MKQMTTEQFAREVVECYRLGYPRHWSSARFVGTWDGLFAAVSALGFRLGMNGDELTAVAR